MPRFSRAAIVPAVVLSLLASAACRTPNDARKRISPEYDQTTGKLKLLKFDANNNGKVDTWSYMDGARVVRIEIDSDEDGRIDRWEYYAADQALERVGLSRANDGKEDAWSFTGPDGSIARIEVSTRRDRTVNRIEHYAHGILVTAEEDTDADGAMDKWETYDGSRLASVGFDTVHRGAPDRRLTYAADGSAQMEFDPDGDGIFTAPVQSAAGAGRAPARGPK